MSKIFSHRYFNKFLIILFSPNNVRNPSAIVENSVESVKIAQFSHKNNQLLKVDKACITLLKSCLEVLKSRFFNHLAVYR